MRTSLAFLSLIAATLTMSNAEDISKPWGSVTFNVPHETSAASVSLVADGSLTKVNLSLIGYSLDVPETELEGIDKPVLHSAQLLFGEDWYGEWKEGEKPIPHFIIELSYGDKSKFGNLPTIRFLFHSGKYQERINLIQTTETVWEEFRKSPGEPPVKIGTTTRAAAGKKEPGER
ncbi:hypothetical protein [Haloferula sp.]|uniref:hypothetical protein n=1 Tax=Haloferula sp. TaxID=2497595 RepID=UPI00329C25B5